MFFGIRDPGWEKIRIRDKHPGSATLVLASDGHKAIFCFEKNPSLKIFGNQKILYNGNYSKFTFSLFWCFSYSGRNILVGKYILVGISEMKEWG